jgi:hypothetical protein
VQEEEIYIEEAYRTSIEKIKKYTATTTKKTHSEIYNEDTTGSKPTLSCTLRRVGSGTVIRGKDDSETRKDLSNTKSGTVNQKRRDIETRRDLGSIRSGIVNLEKKDSETQRNLGGARSSEVNLGRRDFK